MSRVCIRTLASDSHDVTTFCDEDIMSAVRAHADPKWWKSEAVKEDNQAFLRRWRAVVRREARRRGLL